MARNRIAEVLRTLDLRYNDADLRLSHLASQADLSVCHLSRVLKQTTGRGFITHVHARRIAAARELLVASTLSVKEIAGVVGYRSVTQLGRHYRRAYGVTPSAVRLLSLAAGRDTDRKN